MAALSTPISQPAFILFHLLFLSSAAENRYHSLESEFIVKPYCRGSNPSREHSSTEDQYSPLHYSEDRIVTRTILSLKQVQTCLNYIIYRT
jgi:hypothetical protein